MPDSDWNASEEKMQRSFVVSVNPESDISGFLHQLSDRFHELKYSDFSIQNNGSSATYKRDVSIIVSDQKLTMDKLSISYIDHETVTPLNMGVLPIGI